MNCKEFRRELANGLEGVWNTDKANNSFSALRLRPEAAEHAESCQTCASIWKTAISAAGMQNSVASPPPHLAALVKDRISENSSPHDKRKPRLISLSGSVRTRITTAAAAAALAAALVAVVFTGLLLFSNGKDSSVIIRFSLSAPAAEQVNVVGDWNNWNPEADPLLDEDGDGIWEAEIELEPGNEYRYQFYINNSTWISDPKAPLVIEDGFGGLNSIVRI